MAQGYFVQPVERPLGVAILAVLIGIVAAILLVGSLLLFLFGAAAYAHSAYSFFGATIVGAVILLILSLILFAVATGLWDLKLWALVLSIIVVALLWIGQAVTSGLLSLGGILLVLLLIYLAAVHRHFH
jgi:hypothetical protein